MSIPIGAAATSIFDRGLSSLEKARSKQGGAEESRPYSFQTLDQKVSLHPGDARSGLLGDDRTVSDDILGDAFPGLFATDYSSNTRRNSPAMNPAGRVAHGRQHAAIHDGFQRWRHGIDTTDDDAGLSARLHDVGGSQCHVVVVEEGGFDVGILGQMRILDTRDLGDVPVGGIGVQHLDYWIVLHDLLEALGAALGPRMT